MKKMDSVNDTISLYSGNGVKIHQLSGNIDNMEYSPESNVLEFQLDGKRVSVVNVPVAVIVWENRE